MEQQPIKKVTPYRDSTWYVKWIAVVFILIAVMCRSVSEIPKIFDVIFSLLGTFGWLWVGFMWHDRALMVLNSVIVFMLMSSLIRYVFI